MRTPIIAILHVLAASSLAAAQVGATTAPAPNASDSSTIVVPAGTRIPALAVRAISTRRVHPGDTVYLQTTAPVVADGRVTIPAGTYVMATVESATRRGTLHPQFALRTRASSFTFANGYAAAGPSLASSTPVGSGDNGVRRDDGNVQPVLVAVTIAGGVLTGPVVPAIGAGLFAAVLVHPTALTIDPGARIELVLEQSITLDARRVADAARMPVNQRLANAQQGHGCLSPGSPGTPDIMIPGDPGTPAIGDMPGTPPTPPSIIPGMPATGPTWKACP